MVDQLDAAGAVMVLAVFGGLIAFSAGFSPVSVNPFEDIQMYTVEPVPCVQQSPLVFEFTAVSLDATRQDGPAFSTIGTWMFFLGAQDAKITVGLQGTTVNGEFYRAADLEKVFDVDDSDFLLGKDNCFKDTAVSEGIGIWKNVPAGEYTVTFTLTDNGETKDTDTVTAVLPD